MSEVDDKQVREKLVSRGAESLTDAELISIIIQEGSGRLSAVEVAQRLLSQTGGSLLGIRKLSLRQLRMAAGLGVRRAALLSAALELGRRLEREQMEVPTTIVSNEDVIRIFRPEMATLDHEEFWVLYLSSANTVLDKVRVSQGGVSGTVVDYKLIVKRAVERLASGLILVHNHPSGVAQPSGEDRELTDRIVRAASLFDIVVLDHLIITAGESCSFRQLGLIE